MTIELERVVSENGGVLRRRGNGFYWSRERRRE